ncbi:SEC-C domain-containing protein [Melittangium boletus]|uniref:SEC-C motif domain protein n=1 Tax=Melittangium boletus DSM 14713 TaxID=1294270 RepID=A0A250ICE0_9BACT|nr:SEC-C domain-containing protein [Melittangium boletus]ATB29425.1 SEC-C motif domain protein [Melittangium boletus DSM 14713]
MIGGDEGVEWGLLVQRLVRTALGSELQESLIQELEEKGSAVVPVVLEALETERDEDARSALLRVLAGCGARDERILAALLAQLREEAIPGAVNLVTYGDPRAIEPLARMLEDYPLTDDVMDVFAQQTVLELAVAILDLGGRLSEAQRAKADRAWRYGAPLRAALRKAFHKKPGRNEPCWCGSGVKYKKCHLGEDALTGRGCRPAVSGRRWAPRGRHTAHE